MSLYRSFLREWKAFRYRFFFINQRGDSANGQTREPANLVSLNLTRTEEDSDTEWHSRKECRADLKSPGDVTGIIHG